MSLRDQPQKLRAKGRTPTGRSLLSNVRRCHDGDRATILAIINAAAEAYRGVIPADRWHEPYMSPDELDSEIAAGVAFWGYEADGALVGVMAIQPVRDVDLIRHAYVRPDRQGRSTGAALISHLRGLGTRRMLVGTWSAADWAIRFYQRHGFALVSPARKSVLLRAYWIIPDRQIETSVVLANPADEA
jgi:GNAT superfamily N-acetyltransferase